MHRLYIIRSNPCLNEPPSLSLELAPEEVGGSPANRSTSTVNFAESAKYLGGGGGYSQQFLSARVRASFSIKKYLAELISSYLEDLYEFCFE